MFSAQSSPKHRLLSLPLALLASLSAYGQSVEDISLMETAFSEGKAASFQGRSFLSIDDGVHGAELWTTNGTETGTYMVRDINPGAEGSQINNLTVAGDLLYFSATSKTGNELWRTDGTRAGTYLLADIAMGATSSSPQDFAASGDTLYFTAIQEDFGRELWKASGSIASLVADIHPGKSSSSPKELTMVDSTLYFSASAPVALIGEVGRELWKSDGTANGTSVVKDIAKGTVSSNPSEFLAHNGSLYFAATTPEKGNELWLSDGTEKGTILLKDLQKGPDSSGINYLISFNGKVFFNTTEGVHYTDGSRKGTQSASHLAPTSGTFLGPIVKNRLTLLAMNENGIEMWSTDGSTESSEFLHRLLPNDHELFDAPVANGPFIKTAGDLLYFNSYSANFGSELHVTDGTRAGTRLVRDIYPVQNDPFVAPYHLVGNDGQLLFTAEAGISGFELWTSDGTADGTFIVCDIATDRSDFGMNIAQLDDSMDPLYELVSNEKNELSCEEASIAKEMTEMLDFLEIK